MSETLSLEARIKALEAEASGYVRAHVLYFGIGIGFIAGAILGHLVK